MWTAASHHGQNSYISTPTWDMSSLHCCPRKLIYVFPTKFLKVFVWIKWRIWSSIICVPLLSLVWKQPLTIPKFNQMLGEVYIQSWNKRINNYRQRPHHTTWFKKKKKEQKKRKTQKSNKKEKKRKTSLQVIFPTSPIWPFSSTFKILQLNGTRSICLALWRNTSCKRRSAKSISDFYTESYRFAEAIIMLHTRPPEKFKENFKTKQKTKAL